MIRITTAYDEPIFRDIPVKILAPVLEVIGVEQQEGNRVVVVAVKNTGTHDLDAETRFTGTIQNETLSAVSIPSIKAGEKIDLAFVPPTTISTDKNARLTLTAFKQKGSTPVHRWTFPDIPIQLPGLPFALLALLACGAVGLGVATYYLRVYLHPLVTRLSEKPGELLTLPVEQLAPAARLLKRTRRLDTVLAECDVKGPLLENAAMFFDGMDMDERAALLIERVGEMTASSDLDGVRLFTIRLAPEFMLSLDDCTVVMPPREMRSDDVLKVFNGREEFRRTVCLAVTAAGEQREGLKKASGNASNRLVT
ncbi:MAG: hypothetical protein GY859_38510, partial [Desulfobacterales bacterium]|nr:hypothetical protein [Desulfobacterales bacterium]